MDMQVHNMGGGRCPVAHARPNDLQSTSNMLLRDLI